MRELHARLGADGYAPWLDEGDLLPGQDWKLEVQKAVRSSDAALVCLSPSAVTKTGYVQKEILLALDVADEQPEGAIFVIPVRLEACDVPERLKGRQWVDLFSEGGYEKLRRALLRRAEDLGKSVEPGESPPPDVGSAPEAAENVSKSVQPGVPPPSETESASDTDTVKVLGDWMAESRSRWSDLVGQVADEKPAYRLPHGLWKVSYMVLGQFEALSLPELMLLLERVQGHESGWPPWWVPPVEGIRPYPFHGSVECWMGKERWNDPSQADFWRASPLGLMYLLRGYEEDGRAKDTEPGTVLDLTLPMIFMGECLLHAQRFATALAGDAASVALRAGWEGLSGRVLKAWQNPDIFFPGEPRARQSAVVSDIVVPVASIPVQLPQIVERLTLPLYEIFDFARPPSELFRNVLQKMWQPKGKK